VDRLGNPVYDPSKNVDALVAAAIQRQDDLRVQESMHIRELMQRDRDHSKELREIETARLDAIRAVDVGAVQRAAEVQATQAGALAAQVVATADAFRVSLGAALEPIQKDIRDLRDAQSRGVGGKEQVTETSTTGRDQIQSSQARMQMYGLIFAAIVIAISLFSALHK
jgi:hypothetical protein